MSAPYSDPPPAYTESSSSSYQPPPNPPPSTNEKQPTQEPPSYPTPPGISHARSSGFNATEREADRALSWCASYPLTAPYPLSPETLNQVRGQWHDILPPWRFPGTIALDDVQGRSFRVTTEKGTPDTFVQTRLPGYSALADSPLVTEQPRTVYFEVVVNRIGGESAPAPAAAKSSGKSLFKSLKAKIDSSSGVDNEAGVAIGWSAPPYPPNRLPGWHRGSLAVHSDDGRRYVANDEGGIDFTQPFQAGETIGIGMTFSVPGAFVKGGPKLDVEVFVTRGRAGPDGDTVMKKVGWWDLNRDTDMENESAFGLQGEHDLFPSIGVFGSVDISVNYGMASWKYRGY